MVQLPCISFDTYCVHATCMNMPVQVSSSDVMPAQKPAASQAEDANVEVEEPVDAGAKFD